MSKLDGTTSILGYYFTFVTLLDALRISFNCPRFTSRDVGFLRHVSNDSQHPLSEEACPRFLGFLGLNGAHSGVARLEIGSLILHLHTGNFYSS